MDKAFTIKLAILNKSYHNNVMKQIKQVPTHELVFKLRKLAAAAREVAYAHTESEAEYFTIKHLRPLIEETDALLDRSNIKHDLV